MHFLLGCNGINMNQANKDGTTPFSAACRANHSEIVHLLLQQPNININQAMTNNSSKGATPLIIASYLGNYECVQQLLQQSTINTTLTFQNKTALHWSQPNEHANGWEDLDKDINIEGREKILQLLSRDM